MKRQFQLLRALYVEESGQDLIEYSLIVALIALVAIVSMGNLANKINDYVWTNVVDPLSKV